MLVALKLHLKGLLFLRSEIIGWLQKYLRWGYNLRVSQESLGLHKGTRSYPLTIKGNSDKMATHFQIFIWKERGTIMKCCSLYWNS